MENNMEYYVTYKFYDEKGRRLAIFAIPTYKVVDRERMNATGDVMSKDVLQVYIITCSKKDTFSKKKAKEMFEEFLQLKKQGFTGSYAHPVELQIDVNDDKPKFTFLRWCEDNYAKYATTVFAIETRLLYKGEDLVDGRFDAFEILPIHDGDAIPQTTSEN